MTNFVLKHSVNTKILACHKSHNVVERTLASGRDVTGNGSGIYDKDYYLMIKSYSSVVVK
jgi:hypothetical protein